MVFETGILGIHQSVVQQHTTGSKNASEPQTERQPAAKDAYKKRRFQPRLKRPRFSR
jgi:hypothetical protein